MRDDFADVFEATRELDQLAGFALSRLTSRWAVLGCVMARVVAATDFTLCLPPVIGSHASLNLGVAVVGASGAGKGAAERVAVDAVDLDVSGFTTLPFGSGEGISKSFVKVADGELEFHTRNVLFSASEVSSIGAIGARQGSTLYPQLCSLVMGERLGFKNADDARSLIVPAMQYRAAAVLGVQPGRSGPLIEAADMGVPQRFVWLPALDDAITGEHHDARPLRVPRSGLRSNVVSLAGEPVPIELPDQAVALVRTNRVRQVRGETDTLDGHALLTRLKVAVALGILHGRKNVDILDWQLSEIVMQKSDETRAYCIEELEKSRVKKTGERERTNAIARRRGQAAAEIDARDRVKRLLLKHLREAPEPLAFNRLSHLIVSRDRDLVTDALDDLLDEGLVATYQVSNGAAYAAA